MTLNSSWQQAVMRKEICSSLLTRLLEKQKLLEEYLMIRLGVSSQPTNKISDANVEGSFLQD